MTKTAQKHTEKAQFCRFPASIFPNYPIFPLKNSLFLCLRFIHLSNSRFSPPLSASSLQFSDQTETFYGDLRSLIAISALNSVTDRKNPETFRRKTLKIGFPLSIWLHFPPISLLLQENHPFDLTFSLKSSGCS